MKLWKPWKPQLNREFLSLMDFQVLRVINEIFTKFLPWYMQRLKIAEFHSHHNFSVLKATTFFPVRFRTKMKPSTPWNEILSAFKLEVHPGKSACQPNNKELVSSSSTPGLKGCKMGEWDESFNDSLVFYLCGEYLIITGLHTYKLSMLLTWCWTTVLFLYRQLNRILSSGKSICVCYCYFSMIKLYLWSLSSHLCRSLVSCHSLLWHGNTKTIRRKSWAGVSFTPQTTQLITKAEINKICKGILFYLLVLMNQIVSFGPGDFPDMSVFYSVYLEFHIHC